MSSYFDKATHEIREAFRCDDESFKHVLLRVEARVIRDVSLVTGDREFPEDLRESIQGIIALKAVDLAGIPSCLNAQNLEMAVTCRLSWLVSDLHSAFHDVARRSIKTRFGILSDNPDGILSRRAAHDSGE